MEYRIGAIQTLSLLCACVMFTGLTAASSVDIFTGDLSLHQNDLEGVNSIDMYSGVQIGNSSTTNSGDAVAIGENSSSLENRSVSVGKLSNASERLSVAVGERASAKANYTTAVGSNSRALANRSTSVGKDAKASGLRSVALGMSSDANNPDSIALGDSSSVSGNRAIGIGASTNVSQGGGIAIGFESSSVGGGLDPVAIGYSANATGRRSVAIGSGSIANNPNEVSLGTFGTGFYGDPLELNLNVTGNATVYGEGGLDMNQNNVTFEEYSISGQNGIEIGNGSTVSGTKKTVVIGIGSDGNVDNGTAIGHLSNLNGAYSTAVGFKSEAGFDSVAVGEGANSSVNFGTAIGPLANVKKNGGLAVGYDSQAGGGLDSIAIGYAAESKAARSVAIGSGAVAPNKNEVTLGAFGTNFFGDPLRQDLNVTGNATIHGTGDVDVENADIDVNGNAVKSAQVMQLESNNTVIPTCDSSHTGEMRRNSTDDNLYYCNGNSWGQLN